MVVIRYLLLAVAGLAALAAIAYVSLSLYGWERVWETAYGPADQGPVEFENFAKGPKPNQALVCPEGLCDPESVDRVSPIYSISAEELKFALLEQLETRENLGTVDLDQVDTGSDDYALRLVARTETLRFPDTVRIRFIDLEDGRSTIAIYSQSQVGESDFGVNLQRVERYLGYLQPFEVSG